MKHAKLLMISLFSIIMLLSMSIAEESNVIPSVKIKNLRGEMKDTKDFSNDGKPFIINFWATWCKPCITELSNIHDVYIDWQDETGVKIIAVSIDDSRNSKRVAPFVNGRGWEYEVYLDVNGDFKRKMNVNNPPHTFLCNGNGKIVWEHSGYAPGDESHLIEKVKELIENGSFEEE